MVRRDTMLYALLTLLAVDLHAPSPVAEVPVATIEAAAVEIAAESVQLPVFAGYEADWQQQHDALFVRVVAAFNAEHGWTPVDEHHLEPALVKAWALQESGSHREIFTSGDMMQMNNPGDWAEAKRTLGVEPGEALDPDTSLRAALRWAYCKGQVTRRAAGDEPAPGWSATFRDGVPLNGYESRFRGWDAALARYNGGGVANYRGQIERRLASAIRFVRPDPVHGPRMQA